MTAETTPSPADRRARRRQETIEEILAIAGDVMTEEGVNGLSISELARRLGVKPTSIYKYFDSIMGIYNALFERGQRTNLEVMRVAMERSEPGLDALTAGLEASSRWALANSAAAQLLFWRPVPSFEPTPEAMAPSIEMVRLQRQALADAATAKQLGPGADSDEALYVTSVFVSGVIGQAMANDPGLAWARVASARCSPSSSAYSPPSIPRSPLAPAGPETPPSMLAPHRTRWLRLRASTKMKPLDPSRRRT